ncbi:DUF2975 domain-containing protein [Streptomyces ziwulingensis]|uniref:DUF2975 domain-containing protein n=1 Tax=Streptomyces ziwulingensis TaxID=1045501 RepID=UPI0031EAC7F8
MGKSAVLALRAVIVALFVASVFVQAVMVPLLNSDLRDLDADLAYLRVPVLVLTLAGVVTVEVVLACVWRLVTMVRRGTVFSAGAFRYVHLVIGAFVAASLVVFGFAVLLAPGEAVAPGVVGLICLLALAVFGVALIVLVLRTLLAQAVAVDGEASRMRAELAEVI